MVDLYTFDEERGVFGQADGSSLVVPTACDAGGDDNTKMCHFRFVLECEPLPCEDSGVENLTGHLKAQIQSTSAPPLAALKKRSSFFSYFF